MQKVLARFLCKYNLITNKITYSWWNSENMRYFDAIWQRKNVDFQFSYLIMSNWTFGLFSLLKPYFINRWKCSSNTVPKIWITWNSKTELTEAWDRLYIIWFHPNKLTVWSNRVISSVQKIQKTKFHQKHNLRQLLKQFSTAQSIYAQCVRVGLWLLVGNWL